MAETVTYLRNLFAVIRAYIWYSSDERELFTMDNPGYVTSGTGEGI